MRGPPQWLHSRRPIAATSTSRRCRAAPDPVKSHSVQDYADRFSSIIISKVKATESSVVRNVARRKLGLLSRLTREPEGIALAIERSFRFRVQRQESDLRGLWTGIRVHGVRAGLLRAARFHRTASLPLVSCQPQGCAQR